MEVLVVVLLIVAPLFLGPIYYAWEMRQFERWFRKMTTAPFSTVVWDRQSRSLIETSLCYDEIRQRSKQFTDVERLEQLHMTGGEPAVFEQACIRRIKNYRNRLLKQGCVDVPAEMDQREAVMELLVGVLHAAQFCGRLRRYRTAIAMCNNFDRWGWFPALRTRSVACP